MAYNREIGGFAPLPSGPLPTQDELDFLARRAGRRQGATLFAALRQAFRG